ncbi:MAG: hypothetical protein N3D77_16390, partial [Geminicoccaceae bacterium]|nr:hypothetical protein [Geminicoccaceae bacterium]
LMELMARETLPGVYGELSDEDKVDLVVLRETQKLRQYEPDQWPVFSASAAARQLPYTLQAVEGAVTGGLAGAAAGAVGGAAIGSTASGVGAIPGAITGAAALGSRGAIAGSYAQLLPYMIGEAALGLEEIRDVDGQKLDPDLRRGLAVTVGIINSGAEVVGFGALASPVLTLFSDTV